ncbi:MAG: hypothetical protein KJN92_07945 [Gemmatimonadetes bacterium]|nr:hypothetical protein [Gemmatimonadota bacterium]
MYKRHGWTFALALIIAAGPWLSKEHGLSAQSSTLESPAFIASVGQSAGAQQARVLATRAGMEFTFEARPAAEVLAGHKTLIVVLGASTKGLGAAGVDIDAEIAWATELFETARELGMSIVAMHIEGGTRRGPSSDRVNTTFAPMVDHLIVKGASPDQEWAEAEEADGNADGLFTQIAAENGISITYIAKTLEAVGALQQLFGVEAGR